MEHYYVPNLKIFMSHLNYLSLEMGKLVSLMKQWKGPEDFNITKFSKI